VKKTVTKRLSNIKRLIEFVKDEEIVYIQPHNFPDHDAIASAYALQFLFSHFGINAKIVYDGTIQRDSLKHFIEKFKISIHPINSIPMKETDKIIIVDGCKGNNNVTDFIGDEIGVIDHHIVSDPEDVEFLDIRQEYGACSTIILHYFKDLNINIPSNVATTIMIGINMDTLMLTRGVHVRDLEAYFYCFSLADLSYVHYVTRNYINIPDLEYYNYLIKNLTFNENVAFCYFPGGCNQNLLGILSDFILALKEIDFVLLCAKNGKRINFSARSELPNWDAAIVIRKLLDDVGGFGGGHSDMAGGVINDASLFSEDKFKDKFYELLSVKVS